MPPRRTHSTAANPSPLASFAAPLTRLLAAAVPRPLLDEHVFDFYASQLGPQLSLNRVLARVEAIRPEARHVLSFVWVGQHAVCDAGDPGVFRCEEGFERLVVRPLRRHLPQPEVYAH